MDYYQFMTIDIIEQNLEFEHIELVKNQSRFMDNGKLNHAVFEQVIFEMANYFHALFRDEVFYGDKSEGYNDSLYCTINYWVYCDFRNNEIE